MGSRQPHTEDSSRTKAQQVKRGVEGKEERKETKGKEMWRGTHTSTQQDEENDAASEDVERLAPVRLSSVDLWRTIGLRAHIQRAHQLTWLLQKARHAWKEQTTTTRYWIGLEVSERMEGKESHKPKSVTFRAKN